MTVTVRFAPLPPKTMFAFGTRVVLDEVPVSVSATCRCFSVADGEGDGAGRRVFVGGLVGDVRDRRVVVNGGDRQHKGVAAGTAIGIGDGDGDGGSAGLITGGRDGHGAVSAAAAEDDVALAPGWCWTRCRRAFKLAAAVSASPMVKAIASLRVSSLVVWLAMSEMVGLSLTCGDRDGHGGACCIRRCHHWLCR